jgi:hypothetical protein
MTFCGYFFHNFNNRKEAGNSDCQMTLAGIHLVLGANKTTIHKWFDEDETTYEQIKEHMKEFKLKTRSK